MGSGFNLPVLNLYYSLQFLKYYLVVHAKEKSYGEIISKNIFITAYYQ